MSRHQRRAVAFAILAGALLIAALSARGGGDGREVMAQVVVTNRPVAAGRPLRPADLRVATVPRRFLGVGDLGDPRAAVGRRLPLALPAGSHVTAAMIAAPAVDDDARDLAVRLDPAGLPGGAISGARADLYLTTPGHTGATRRILAGVLVVAVERDQLAPVATLRVHAGDVAALIAAEGAGALRLVGRV